MSQEHQDKLNEEFDRGLQAKMLLDNPLLNEALEDLREQTVKAIETGVAKTDKQHARLFLTLQLIKTFRAKLERHIQTGKLAEATLADVARGHE